MPSVAARILLALQARVMEIRGQGAMVNDLQGRVFLTRVSYDVEAESTPAVFIARRIGGGSTIEQKPGESSAHADTTVIFDIVAAVPLSPTCSLDGENMLADLHRALEIPGDEYIADSCVGKNLLSQELRIVEVQFSTPQDELPFDLVGVGMQCTYPHIYGDPDHVA